MARPNKQRDQAKTLYAAGVPPRTISEQLGIPYDTVTKWRTRDNWRSLRDGFKEHLNRAAEVTIGEAAERVRNRLAEGLEHATIDLIDAPRQPDLDGLEKRTRVLSGLVGASSKLFGWDQEGKTIQLFAVVGVGSAPDTSQQSIPSSPTIDVQEVSKECAAECAVDHRADQDQTDGGPGQESFSEPPQLKAPPGAPL